jgi:lysophospholipase L1-like esterase
VKRLLLGVGLTVFAVVVVLVGETVYVLNQDFLGADDAPDIGTVLEGPAGAPVVLTVLGDSTAAGVGVDDQRDSVAGLVAVRLAQRSRVTVVGNGVSGARAADLPAQVDDLLGNTALPDVVLILIGPNDATHLTRLGPIREDVGDAVRRLREAHIAVVVGSCADMGSATAFPRPLREISAWRGRAVGRAARQAAREAGAAVVDIGAETGPAFRRDPDRYLSEDGFHPSAAGYRLWAEAVQDEVLAAALA